MSSEEFLALLDEAGFDYEKIDGPGEIIFEDDSEESFVETLKERAVSVTHKYVSEAELDVEYKGMMARDDFYKDQSCKNVPHTYADAA